MKLSMILMLSCLAVFLMLSTTSAAPAPAPTVITADLGALLLAKLLVLKGNIQ